MANTTSTPLTRYGRRVATATTATSTPTVTRPPSVKAEPTIRAMVVCVPDELPTAVVNGTRQLDRHFGVAALADPRFWATGSLQLWQRGHMFDLCKTTTGPRYCAGGPVRLLDLAGMRHGAAVGAGLRHQYWAAVVRGTPNATRWPAYVQRHLDDPARYPIDTARAEFESQPRVLAMRMHNAAAIGAAELDPYELEVLQAGPAAYCHYHCMWTVCTDAVLTVEGTRLQPASDHLTDRVRYLSQAIRYIESLDARQRLLAVTL